MYNIAKNTLCQNSKIKKSIFIIQYHISQRITQIFEILGLYCFALVALAIDKTFTQRHFSPGKFEIASMYFPKKFKNKGGRKFVKF